MILVFLGSWRSTLIITVSIPLAVLCSLIALSALGQTINVMTLGGLALAVGILVDDATVTIENINRHMEEFGEDIVTAITRGAQEIMPPAPRWPCSASASPSCPCWRSGRGGLPVPAAGDGRGLRDDRVLRADLHRRPDPRALLLKEHVHGDGAGRPGLFTRFQRGFERRFESLRQGYLGLLSLALAYRRTFASGFLLVVGLSFLLLPYLGRDFFPAIESDALRIHVRAPTGTRIEEMTALTGRIENRIRSLLPPDRVTSVVNNIGLPISGINISYGNSGTIGTFDADMLVTLAEGEGEASPAVLTRELRERLPRTFRRDLRVPAGGHRQPDPELRCARRPRRADRGGGPGGQPARRLHPPVPHPPSGRRGRRPHPGARQQPVPAGRLQSDPWPVSSASPRGMPPPASRRAFRGARRSRRPSGSTRATACPTRSRSRHRNTASTPRAISKTCP